MSNSNQRTLGASALVVLGVVFVAATMLANALFSGWRLDLTDNNLYTISPGTRNLLAQIEEPINLYFFFSDRATEALPQLRTYATRVQEVLEELSEEAGDKLHLSTIDPLPFSEDEDRANQFGLQGVSLSATTDAVYLGLAGTNAVGDESLIAFFDPGKEPFLEYDLAKMIYTLMHPDKPVIGLLSSLPMTAGFDPQTQQMRPPWVIVEQLQQLFELRTLSGDGADIDSELDVLMIVHPKSLSDSTLYAIDQYILGGGRALIMVDPYAEADVPVQDPNNPQAAMFATRSSAMPKLFAAWGIEVSSSEVVGDDGFALQVGGGPGQRPVYHIGLLGVTAGGVNAEDVVSADLGSINMGYTGYISSQEDAAVTVGPLLWSSGSAMPFSAEQLRFTQDPAGLRNDFAPTGERYVLAARLTGEVESAFPDGSPQQLPTTDVGSDNEPTNTHLERSDGPVNVVLIADTDMLSDRFWVRAQNFFGQRLYTAFANNGDLIINSLDNLTGSSDLISIRSRASYSRPFTRVDALRRQADEQFRQTEQELQDQLAETEQRLTDLQQSRDDANAFALTPEQEIELDRFRDQRIRIRKDLRRVRRELDKNIENLGTALKVINIGLMPLLLTGLALLLWRLARRKAAGRPA